MTIAFGSTAYLLVILDENGNRKDVGIYSERSPTMRFADTACLVMHWEAETYSEARDAIVKSLRSMGGHRAWLLRELGEL
jgi:hypothetical protein